jgi:hypothetical protein
MWLSIRAAPHVPVLPENLHDLWRCCVLRATTNDPSIESPAPVFWGGIHRAGYENEIPS